MERAREHGITVILSGQGADEIFCGYRKFLGFHVQALLRAGRVLEAARDLGGFFVNRTVVTQFSFQEARRYLPGIFSSMRLSVAGEALEGFEPVAAGLPSGATLRERQIADVKRFSVPVLTHYEDRMSMAWSREVRTPFLDYRLVEAAISLPSRLKLAHGWTKYALRKAMEPLLPAPIAWRKDKQNFVNPQSEWLKTDLREAVLGIFKDPSSLIFRHRLLAQPGLIALYERYCRQPVDRGAVSFKQIFQPLALELWLRNYSRFLAEPVKVAA
jgi:asparagine synthase (glutamine-hydrolysing)